MKTKIVIIGGGAGGMTAAAQLGKIKEKYRIFRKFGGYTCNY